MKQAASPLIQLTTFFVLTFAIAWSAWIPSFLHPESLRLLSFVGLFAPAISALIVTFYFYKAKGVRELLSRFKRIRFGISWYALVILLLPFLFILSYWLNTLFFHISVKSILLPTSAYFVLFAFVWLIVINSGEEIGWRGFALPRLQILFKNPLLASLVLGILWSAWHLPIYLTPGQSSFPIALFFFFIIGLSFIYTVVFNNTGGSLFSAVLLHASTDVVPRIINITTFNSTTWLILAILTWLSAIFIIIINKQSYRNYILAE